MLLGCRNKPSGAGQGNKNTSEVDTISKNIINSIEAFENRRIYKVLNTEIIDTTIDQNLIQTVFDNLVEKLPPDYEQEKQAVLKWTKPQQAIFIIWQLEAEVNNGGFNQFYYNSTGQYADLVPDALKLVGANKFAFLATEANKIYHENYAKITKHQDGSAKGFSKSYEDNPLDKFDDKFYALYKEEDLQQLQVDFIRKNKQYFIDR